MFLYFALQAPQEKYQVHQVVTGEGRMSYVPSCKAV